MKTDIKIPAPFWIVFLYFAEGIPAAVICDFSVVMFAAFGWSAAKTAFCSGLLGLPWVFKPLWAPAVDMISTKRRWITSAQFALAAVFAAAAFFSTPALAGRILFSLLFAAAVLSATHDIAADGYYIIALDEYRQALYSGWRSIAFRIAMVAGNGGPVLLVAWLAAAGCTAPWRAAMFLPAAVFLLLAIYHCCILPAAEQRRVAGFFRAGDFISSFGALFRKPCFFRVLMFLLFYRIAESQLGTVAKLFLLSPHGASMPLENYGFSATVAGTSALLAGGVIGGIVAAKIGLRKALPLMAMTLNLPDIVYVLWAFFPTGNFILQTAAIMFEQFGYGIGFTGYMLLMVCFASSSGKYQTSHFALLTGVMVLGLRLPGMVSGKLLESFTAVAGSETGGFQCFFIWVMLATLISFAVTVTVLPAIPAGYGLKSGAGNR